MCLGYTSIFQQTIIPFIQQSLVSNLTYIDSAFLGNNMFKIYQHSFILLLIISFLEERCDPSFECLKKLCAKFSCNWPGAFEKARFWNFTLSSIFSAFFKLHVYHIMCGMTITCTGKLFNLFVPRMLCGLQMLLQLPIQFLTKHTCTLTQ